ncbi:hypothetical protein ABF176_002451, partial [Flavobacterium psychrophilum]
MSRLRYVKGNITEITGGTRKIFALEGYEVHSNAQIINNAKEGKHHREPDSAPKIEKKLGKVKKVKLITKLELGSKNDKLGNFQKGMVFGKEYTFQVTEYENETPTSKKLTKWQIRYHSPKDSKNKWIDVPIKKDGIEIKGDKVTITMDEKDMCGRFVYIRAYIDDPKTEGEHKEWKHNRFRWFDRMIVKEEIK